jgi:hypothetical protein
VIDYDGLSAGGGSYPDRFPVERYQPMAFLFDDADALSIGPSRKSFRRLRSQRRRIFRMYVAEFRRESLVVIEERLAAIGRNGEWDDLGPAIARTGRLFTIWLKFYRAWFLHGLHAGRVAPQMVQESLKTFESLLSPVTNLA